MLYGVRKNNSEGIWYTLHYTHEKIVYSVDIRFTKLMVNQIIITINKKLDSAVKFLFHKLIDKILFNQIFINIV